MKNKSLQTQIVGLGAFIGITSVLFIAEPKLQAQPVITNQPADVTTNAGGRAQFTVGASGALGYHWWFTRTNLTGNLGPTLFLNNVQTNQAGGYWVVVTNLAGSVTSRVATLTVNSGNPVTPEAPAITSQPVDVTTNAGATATFSVTTTGSAPLGYNWWFSGTNFSVGNSATLALRNVKTYQDGSYFVVVTNSAGAVTSSVAELTVFTVQATNAPGLWLVSHSPTNGDVLKLVLDIGNNYRVQSSSDMVNWSDVTNFFSDVSVMYITNSAATGQGGLFYRLVSP